MCVNLVIYESFTKVHGQQNIEKSIVVGQTYRRERPLIVEFNMSALVSALLCKASITETLLVRLLYSEIIFKIVFH